MSSVSDLNVKPNSPTVLFFRLISFLISLIRKIGSFSFIFIEEKPKSNLFFVNERSCKVSFNRHGPAVNPCDGRLEFLL